MRVNLFVIAATAILTSCGNETETNSSKNESNTDTAKMDYAYTV